jgi:hypothetical protein
VRPAKERVVSRASRSATGTVAAIERGASSAVAVSGCVGVDMMIEGEPRLSMNGELN